MIVAIVVTTVIGLIGGAVASRSAGIYFLMITLTYSVIATYTLGQVTKISGFSGIGGINGYTPGWIGDVLDHPNRLYYIALGVAIVVYVLIRYIVRTPFGIALQGVRDEPVRMASLGYNVAAAPDARVRLRGVPRLARRRSSTSGGAGRSRPGDVDLPQTINLLIMAVIGGLAPDRGRLARRIRLHRDAELHHDDDPRAAARLRRHALRRQLQHLIGIIFLVIVLVSPDGLMGIWGRLFEPTRRFGRGAGPPAETAGAEPAVSR